MGIPHNLVPGWVNDGRLVDEGSVVTHPMMVFGERTHQSKCASFRSVMNPPGEGAEDLVVLANTIFFSWSKTASAVGPDACAPRG